MAQIYDFILPSSRLVVRQAINLVFGIGFKILEAESISSVVMSKVVVVGRVVILCNDVMDSKGAGVFCWNSNCEP